MSNLIDLKTTTNFQKKVYEALLEIPIGKITTYKLLGAYIGCKSSQAIGQALKRNPFAPDVPCHRVIKSDLNIGGYVGHTEGAEVSKKKKLLAEEGVLFDTNNKLSDVKKIFSF